MRPCPILPFGSSHRAFGHTGSGGSFAFADPDRRLGYAYAMNRAGFAIPTDPRELAVRAALERAIGNMK
jgi:CubicO group peptidase (beta-lactamase class C family)